MPALTSAGKGCCFPRDSAKEKKGGGGWRREQARRRDTGGSPYKAFDAQLQHHGALRTSLPALTPPSSARWGVASTRPTSTSYTCGLASRGAAIGHVGLGLRSSRTSLTSSTRSMTTKRMVRSHPLVDRFDALAGIGPDSHGGGRPLPGSPAWLIFNSNRTNGQCLHGADVSFIRRRRARMACELPSARVLADGLSWTSHAVGS